MSITTGHDLTDTRLGSRSRRRRARALAMVAGAVGAGGVHLGALAAGVDMEVPAFGGEGKLQIALVGVILSALVAVAIGWAVAAASERWAPRPRPVWLAFALVGLALSFVPLVAIEATAATRWVLAAEHVVVAAVVLPTFARTLVPVRWTS